MEADPTDGSNNVLRITKSDTAELWAGATMYTNESDFSIDTLAIAEGQTAYTMRVWAPAAEMPILLKVEDAGDPTKSVETYGYTSSAETWETITFDFANEAEGTAVVDYSYTYNKASVFPNFGTTGADAGTAITIYVDDFDEGW